MRVCPVSSRSPIRISRIAASAGAAPARHVAWAAAAIAALWIGGGSAMAQNAAKGQAVFLRTCGLCHAAQPGANRIGPSLYGVVGRKAGTEAGYSYSTAMKSANLVWTPQELDKYLTNPHSQVPGTKMTFPGLPDAAQRQDVIAYLQTLHG